MISINRNREENIFSYFSFFVREGVKGWELRSSKGFSSSESKIGGDGVRAAALLETKVE